MTEVAIKPAFLNRKKVGEFLGDMSVDTVERMVREGELPKPRQISKKLVGWYVPELEEWAKKRQVSSNVPVANCGWRA